MPDIGTILTTCPTCGCTKWILTAEMVGGEPQGSRRALFRVACCQGHEVRAELDDEIVIRAQEV